jgi:hypothetical protein
VTPDRLSLTVRAIDLRGRGFLHREIAAELGISPSYAQALITDPAGTTARARKERLSGTCPRCGGRRSYGATMCRSCRDRQRRVTRKIYWTQERIIESIRWWAETHDGEPPSVHQWNPTYQESVFARQREAEETRRLIAEKKIPWFSHVVRKFGSWNAGIMAAGFEPKRPNGR